MPEPFRHSRIVCTLGPATDRRGVLEACLEAGLDVARINAAHGSPEEHARRIRRVRRLAGSLGRPLAVLLDLPGPKLRLGRLEGGVRELRRGVEVTLGFDPGAGGLPVRIPRLSRQVKAGESISLSDGSVRLRVTGTGNGRVRARVLVGGSVRSGSGINLPESRLTIRLPTEDDLRWIRFAREQKIDWVGVSFVRTAADVAAVRAKVGRSSRVLAKIEKRQALEELGGVVEAADGVMVARGDLGVETPLHEVPIVQKRIIAEANRFGRPVITATQMLESMVENPVPTRAEVTDVANAILDGTDAVMLSAETAIGAHPVRAVQVLRDVILATEKSYRYGAPLSGELAGEETATLEAALAAEAVRLAAGLGARAIVMPAETLRSVAALARLRPRAPLLALTSDPSLFRELALVWGVAPLRLAPEVELGERIAHARRWLRTRGIRGRGPLVLLSSSHVVGRRLDTLRVL